VGVPARRRGRGGGRGGGRDRNAPMPSRPHRPGRRAKLAPFYTAAATRAAKYTRSAAAVHTCCSARPERRHAVVRDFRRYT